MMDTLVAFLGCLLIAFGGLVLSVAITVLILDQGTA